MGPQMESVTFLDPAWHALLGRASWRPLDLGADQPHWVGAGTVEAQS